ncbi:MAG: protein TolR [Alphaproteobacteria bacterium]|nr:protein TolR [Alphaproteobacteria bacterium]
MGVSLHNNSSGRSIMGQENRYSRRVMSEINVTPFVDVMLVLLIIFMVTAPLMTMGVEVELPEETAQPIAGQDEPLVLTIDKQGKVYLEESRIELKDLVAKLDAVTNRKKDTRIFLRGDKGTDYGNVMAVMSRISSAGFSKVGLVTEPDEG